MQVTITRSSLAAFLLAAGVVTVGAAAAQKDGASAAAPTCSKMLKGVVHLNDTDVRFARKGGGVVFVDPTTGPSEAQTKTKLVKADLILITHPHGDHFQPAVLRQYIEANPQVVLAGPPAVAEAAKAEGIKGVQVVEPNRSYTLAGFEIGTVPAYFDGKDGKESSHPQPGGWVGYVLSLNGARYYVTGDTQPLPEMKTVKADVILPLLSGCGGNMDQALKMAKLSGASVVVPVHTSGKVETIKKYIASLPQGVQAAFYLDGKLNIAD